MKAFMERVLCAGGCGYLMKNAGGEKLLQAIPTRAGGQVCVSEAMSRPNHGRFATAVPADAGGSYPLRRFTEREFGVFELLGVGRPHVNSPKTFTLAPRLWKRYRLQLQSKS
jgi:DNA-binding NarL/FixJ family response regulator